MLQRVVTPEQMDEPGVDEAQLAASLRFIRRVNRVLLGSAAVVGHFKRWSRAWQRGKRGQRITVLDLATGSADIPVALTRWAARAGFDLHVTALDLHPTTLRLAAAHIGDNPRVELVRGDALKPPFTPGSFDYVISSMFLHHLPDIEVMTALRIMDKLARRGMVWNDLLRNRRAAAWCRVITLGQPSIVRHDALTSVRAGFTPSEVRELQQRLSLSHLRYRGHVAHRFTLAGERGGN